jgi:CHAD domain-containing protein
MPEIMPRPIRVSRRSSVGEFAHAALAANMAILVRHARAVRSGDDAEAVHQTRVATRRLRAVFGLLRDFLPPSFLRLREDLAWLGRALGDLRDLDVRIVQASEWQRRLAALGDEPLAELLAALRTERGEAHQRAVAALDSDRYVALMGSLREEFVAESALSSPRGQIPAREALPPLVSKRRRRLKEALAELGPDTPPERYHQARIVAKRLRYAVELAAPLVPKASRRYARCLADLQDVLGRHQDACTSISSLAIQAKGSTAYGAFGMGALAHLFTEQAEECRARVPRVASPVVGREWRRYKARLAAVLD